MTNKNCNWKKNSFSYYKIFLEIAISLLYTILKSQCTFAESLGRHFAKLSGSQFSLSTPYSLSYSFLIQCRRHSRYNLEVHRGETRENYYNNRRRLYRLKPDANFQSGRFPTSRAIVNEIVPRVSVRIRRDARGGERDETAPLTALSPRPLSETAGDIWNTCKKLSRSIAARVSIGVSANSAIYSYNFAPLSLCAFSFSDTTAIPTIPR